jgi:thioesterase domain-containing protein
MTDKPPEPAIATEPMIPLRLNGAGTPLFCIHPAGGNIGIYQPLVKQLPMDLNVYAIQAVENGADDPAARLEEMAAHYARLIQERDPNGPYCLFGFSFGGTVALAIARQLEQAGKPVAFVGLVEAMTVSDRTDKSQLLRRLIMETFGYLEREIGVVKSLTLTDLGSEAENLVERLMPTDDMAGQIQTLMTWLQSRDLLNEEIDMDEVRRYLALMSRHIGMTARHAVEPVEAPVYLWAAEQGWMGLVDTPENLELLSRKSVVHHTATGTHYTVMREPNVGPIARQLQGLMQGLRERHH